MDIGCAIDHHWHQDIRRLQRFVNEAEAAGFQHVSTSGHLMTARPARYPERPVATYGLPYRDPFTFFASVASATSTIRLRTSILILPLLPTVLVAKQAAELSNLTGGRFDLGVGSSWQVAEYQALGQDIHRRGRRMEEQMTVLRQLWTQPYVTFHGAFHDIDDLGIGELPDVPVPLWIGTGSSPALLDRVGRLADGWLSIAPLRSTEAVDTIHRAALAANRVPPAIGGRIAITPSTAIDDYIADARAQAQCGATALCLSAPGVGIDEALPLLSDVRDRIAASLEPDIS